MPRELELTVLERMPEDQRSTCGWLAKGSQAKLFLYFALTSPIYKVRSKCHMRSLLA